jgi:DNA-binding MarR family transcriptional regulator
MGPIHNLTYLTHHLAAVMDKQSEKELHDALGIGLSQYRILMVLEWNPRLQQHSIAASLGQTEASISRQIKLLTEQGLLTVKQDPQNRRKHITAATPKGMQVTEAANDLLRRSASHDLAHLPDTKMAELMDTLHRLHRIVCHSGKYGACDHSLGL